MATKNCGLARAGNSRGHRHIRRPRTGRPKKRPKRLCGISPRAWLARGLLGRESPALPAGRAGLEALPTITRGEFRSFPQLGPSGVRSLQWQNAGTEILNWGSRRKGPAEAGHKCGKWGGHPDRSIFRASRSRPSALGHDGRWRWRFANRSLADRPLGT